MTPKRAALLPGQKGCLMRVIHPERIEKARQGMLDGRELSRLGFIFKALADPTRLLILMALRGGRDVRLRPDRTAHGQRVGGVPPTAPPARSGPGAYPARRSVSLLYPWTTTTLPELLDVGLEHVRE